MWKIYSPYYDIEIKTMMIYGWNFLLYSGDLNTEHVRYSNGTNLSRNGLNFEFYLDEKNFCLVFKCFVQPVNQVNFHI